MPNTLPNAHASCGLPTWIRSLAKWTQVAAITAIGSLVLTSAGFAQLTPASEASSFAVLLKNERVLSGKLTTESDRYVIELAEGSNVIVPHDKVRFVGRSLREVYDFKVRSIQSMTPGDHFNLTRWCMANGLLAEASEHYFEVKKDSPNHVRVVQLGEELKLKMLEDPGFRTFVGLPPRSSPNSEAISPSKPTSQAAVVTVNAETQQLLDRLAQNPAVVRHYSERIQPILMNRCSQSGCHSNTQKDIGFIMLRPRGKNQSETTIANLRTVLQQIEADGRQPGSRLTQYATTAHGNQRKPGIGVHETKLVSELLNWIQLVRNPVFPAVGSRQQGQNAVTTSGGMHSPIRPGNYSPAVTLMPVSPGASQLIPVPKQLEHDQVITALEGSLNGPSGIKPANDYPDDFVPPSMEEIDKLDAFIRSRLGNQPPATKDPFDPEEFNRMNAQPVGKSQGSPATTGSPNSAGRSTNGVEPSTPKKPPAGVPGVPTVR